jgi:hypothetical protein
MGIESSTASLYWHPAALLIAHSGGTLLVNGLLRFSGGQVQVDEKGRICVDSVTVVSSGY